MGDRATFQIDGADVVLYSHWGGDISWIVDVLRKRVDDARSRSSIPGRLTRPDADALILEAARECIFDRIWAVTDKHPDVGDNGHYLLHAPPTVPTSEWKLERFNAPY